MIDESERVVGMEAPLRLNVSGVSLLCGVESPQMLLVRADPNSGDEAPVLACNSEQAHRRKWTSNADVLHVPSRGHIAEIRPAIIGAITVHVVDLISRPCTFHVQES